jgi:hypothetical protein
MAFGGSPSAPSVPDPLGIVLVGTSPFDRRIPQSGQPGSSDPGRSVSTKHSVVYETFQFDNGGGFPQLAPFVVYPPFAASGPPPTSNPDVGIMTTRDPRAVLETASGALDGNQAHGLPSNFGKGRGLWLPRDIRHFLFEIEATNTAPIDPPNGVQRNRNPVVQYVAHVFTPRAGDPEGRGDFDFYFQNFGATASGTGPFQPPVNKSPPEDGVFGQSPGGMRLRVTYHHSAVR